MAARGMSLYAKKQTLVDPLFYARKRETDLPFSHIKDMTRNGLTYQRMLSMHPNADKEDIRLRGIKAIESVEGDNTLSQLDRMDVEMTAKMANDSRSFKANVMGVISDSQKSSFLSAQKVQMLKEKLQ